MLSDTPERGRQHHASKNISLEEEKTDNKTVRVECKATGEPEIQSCNSHSPTPHIKDLDDGAELTQPIRPVRLFPSDDHPSDTDNILPPGQWVQSWLVAISGPMKGQSFPICYGRNQIGRSNECRICLTEDSEISRKQIVVRFKEQSRTFIVKPHDDASQVTVLNHTEELDEVAELKRGDILKLSSVTSLRFIPFCDAGFIWSYPTPQDPFTVHAKQDWMEQQSKTKRIKIDAVASELPLYAMGREPEYVSKITPIPLISSAPLKSNQWVQGWLVAISGPQKGRGYPLCYGRNLVGKSPACAVCLTHDDDIADKQLTIRYKESTHAFIVKEHDDSTRISVINGSVEPDEYVSLCDGDTIKLSPATTLRFVSFCDTDFSWDCTDL